MNCLPFQSSIYFSVCTQPTENNLHKHQTTTFKVGAVFPGLERLCFLHTCQIDDLNVRGWLRQSLLASNYQGSSSGTCHAVLHSNTGCTSEQFYSWHLRGLNWHCFSIDSVTKVMVWKLIFFAEMCNLDWSLCSITRTRADMHKVGNHDCFMINTSLHFCYRLKQEASNCLVALTSP